MADISIPLCEAPCTLGLDCAAPASRLGRAGESPVDDVGLPLGRGRSWSAYSLSRSAPSRAKNSFATLPRPYQLSVWSVSRASAGIPAPLHDFYNCMCTASSSTESTLGPARQLDGERPDQGVSHLPDAIIVGTALFRLLSFFCFTILCSVVCRISCQSCKLARLSSGCGTRSHSNDRLVPTSPLLLYGLCVARSKAGSSPGDHSAA